MKGNLLDVNFLVALAWPQHVSHRDAQAWFLEHRQESFATCPITETGFIRISMNPAVVSERKTLNTVLEILERYRSLPEHVFWNDDLSARAALERFDLLAGYRQVTDAYLLALAMERDGRLVTFDRGLNALIGPESSPRLVVVETRS